MCISKILSYILDSSDQKKKKSHHHISECIEKENITIAIYTALPPHDGKLSHSPCASDSGLPSQYFISHQPNNSHT
ncbi:hypothetical protein RclHR1_00370019 [Rhizophagus clarus]|uniref:Uncharacterized protein n=1 Tax=Rhizophagus clarus TaxID=94130 RepID=A0A2Z6S756_9GLOM|nr:hypothetical protein RclHR1_00370019 [Rhizophagus clarus]GET03577.1 hypothetical protein RCL_e16299_RclHR1_00370019 [Rhizophagus clarus]